MTRSEWLSPAVLAIVAEAGRALSDVVKEPGNADQVVGTAGALEELMGRMGRLGQLAQNLPEEF